MVISVNIGDKTVNLSTNAAAPIFYKKFFNQDFFKEIFEMATAFDKIKGKKNATANIVDSGVDLYIFYRFFWLFAYCSDKNIKPFEDYFAELETFNLEEIAQPLYELLEKSFATKKK